MKTRWTMMAMVVLALAGSVQAKDKADGKKAKMGPRKVLTQFDTNKNGKIDGAEAEKLRQAFAGDLKEQLKRFDLNGDGKLDDAEIAAIKLKKSDKDAAATPAPAPGTAGAKNPAVNAPAK
jgi:Ca2+-binding EF-hand superfamily protein